VEAKSPSDQLTCSKLPAAFGFPSFSNGSRFPKPGGSGDALRQVRALVAVCRRAAPSAMGRGSPGAEPASRGAGYLRRSAPRSLLDTGIHVNAF